MSNYARCVDGWPMRKGVPAFVVFSDATLKGLAAAKPTKPQEMLRVSGVGPAKLERYGEAFLSAIRQHSSDAPRDNPDASRSEVGKPDRVTEDRPLGDTHQLTLQLLQQGFTIAEIATERGLSPGTVVSHVERIVKTGQTVNLNPLLPLPDRKERIEAVLRMTGHDRLAPVKEWLGEDYSYEEIRLVRLANHIVTK